MNVYLKGHYLCSIYCKLQLKEMKKNRYLSPTAKVLRRYLVLTLVLTACLTSYAQKNRTSAEQKPTVLILATYHMSNPGRDVMNVQSDDVLTEKRQKEIREFVSLLKRFKPTKIAVEMPIGSTKLDEQYSRYLRGEYQLGRYETDQIGFRMAKELNHQKMYGVDAAGAFDIGRVFAFAGANNQQDIVDRGMAIGKRQVAEENKLIQTGTIREIYKFINDQGRIDEAHRVYLMMQRIGKDKEYPGVDLLANFKSYSTFLLRECSRKHQKKQRD